MDVTRRFWAIAGIGALLCGYALLLGRLEPLAGAAFVWGWLVSHQFRFVTQLRAIDRNLTVEQTIDPEHVRTDEPVPATLAVSLDRPTPIPLTIIPGLPIGATSPADGRSVSLASSDDHSAMTIPISFPIAGAARFEHATVSMTDTRGLFAETIRRGTAPTLHVSPRSPRNIHIGEGGQQVAASFGEHSAGRLGAGLDPAELR